MQIHIYTDGSHIKGTDILGYGAYCLHDKKEYQMSGICDEVCRKRYNIDLEEKVSNPTMEMIALAETLRLLCETGKSLEGHTLCFWADYTGVGEWMYGRWQCKKYYIKNAKDKATQHLTQLKCEWKIKHVKGHSGTEGNERADRLAKDRTTHSNFHELMDIIAPPVPKKYGQVRVGNINKIKEYKGFTPIIVMTKSSPYASLSPYVLKDKYGRLMENVWQAAKIYKEVPYSKQRYSAYDNTVIWEHPAETHMDDNDKPTAEYWEWRNKLMYNKYPVRYPVGYDHRHSCKGALVEENGTLLGYVDARKQIYVKLYCRLVRRQQQFKELQKRLKKGENLLILEVDGPHQESLSYYMDTYGVEKSFIDKNTMLATEEYLSIMLNDTKHPFGHGYCLAAALLGIERELI